MKIRHDVKIYALTLSVILISLSFARVATGNGDNTVQYLVGTGFLCDLGPGTCPDVTSASNGDKVYVSGSGSFDPNLSDQQITGGGSFVHTHSDGTLVASGTWSAQQLISFTPGGFSTLGGVLPEGSEGGVAVITVHLSPATGGAGLTATLTIRCALATASAAPEGIFLNVVGGPNFNVVSTTSPSGITLFIQQ